MDWIKVLEATAWPFAVIFTTTITYFLVRLILHKKGSFTAGYKDFQIKADGMTASNDQKLSTPPMNQGAVGEAPAQALALATSSEDGLSSPPREAEEAEKSPFMMMYEAKSLDDLNKGLAAFEARADQSDIEFWKVYYVDRQRDLGIGGNNEELERLAGQNPKWVAPLNSLVRRSVESYDLEKAEVFLSRALERSASPEFGSVLVVGIHLYNKLVGPHRALQFIAERIAAGVTDQQKGLMFSTLASHLKSSSKIFDYRVAAEMAILADPSRSSDLFNLAYSYGDDSHAWPLTLSRYNKIKDGDFDFKMAQNNLGVLFSDLDRASQIDYYERAAALGNVLASSNLARLLIDDGFVGEGLKILDAIEDPQDAEEHIASTRAAAMRARRVQAKRRGEIIDASAEQAGRYNATIWEVLRFVEAEGKFKAGWYKSTDDMIKMNLQPDEASIELRSGAAIYEGQLAKELFAFHGNIATKGQTILTTSWQTVSAFPMLDGTVSAVIWPQSVAVDDQMRMIELKSFVPIEAP
jgi:hypothetical protein